MEIIFITFDESGPIASPVRRGGTGSYGRILGNIIVGRVEPFLPYISHTFRKYAAKSNPKY
jgi:hypothetical protein